MSLLSRKYINHIQISLMHKIKKNPKKPAILAETLADIVNKVSSFEFE